MTTLLHDAIERLRTRQPQFIIGPRPGKKSFKALSYLNLTHCCTLLSEREGAAMIEKICSDLHCEWIWLPIEGGRLDVLRNTDLASHVIQLSDAILRTTDAPLRIYVHCSAGIHRTGFFVYALLRLSGQPQPEARAELSALRQVTAEQVGSDRLALADAMAADLLQQSREE